MRKDNILLASIAGMVVALGLMIGCLAWPSPLMIGIFLALGPSVAILSVTVFGVYVLRDLHRRRAL
jgi:maltodextrin utilization protein YvdJ